jgi:hypothetical protein
MLSPNTPFHRRLRAQRRLGRRHVLEPQTPTAQFPISSAAKFWLSLPFIRTFLLDIKLQTQQICVCFHMQLSIARYIHQIPYSWFPSSHPAYNPQDFEDKGSCSTSPLYGDKAPKAVFLTHLSPPLALYENSCTRSSLNHFPWHCNSLLTFLTASSFAPQHKSASAHN